MKFITQMRAKQRAINYKNIVKKLEKDCNNQNIMLAEPTKKEIKTAINSLKIAIEHLEAHRLE